MLLAKCSTSLMFLSSNHTVMPFTCCSCMDNLWYFYSWALSFHHCRHLILCKQLSVY